MMMGWGTEYINIVSLKCSLIIRTLPAGQNFGSFAVRPAQEQWYHCWHLSRLIHVVGYEICFSLHLCLGQVLFEDVSQ